MLFRYQLGLCKPVKHQSACDCGSMPLTTATKLISSSCCQTNITWNPRLYRMAACCHHDDIYYKMNVIIKASLNIVATYTLPFPLPLLLYLFCSCYWHHGKKNYMDALDRQLLVFLWNL